MGCSDHVGHRVCGAAVARRPCRPRAVGADVCWHPGDGSLERVQLVPGAVASGVLGALTEGFRSDARPWWRLRGAWRRLAGAGAPDVYVVASGARGHLETLDVSFLHDPASSRGRAVIGSGQSVWCAQNRGDVSGHPEAARSVVDIRAGRRGGTDEQCGGEVAPSRCAVAKGKLWHAE